MIAFLLSPIGRLLMAGIAGLAIGFGAGFQLNGWRMGSQIGPLKAKVSRLQARSIILESANAQCEKSVLAQNEAVNRLLAAGKEREKLAAKAIVVARAQSATLQASITATRAIERPTSPECAVQAAAAAKLIADEIKGRVAR